MKCSSCKEILPNKNAKYCPRCGTMVQYGNIKPLVGTYLDNDKVTFSCLIEKSVYLNMDFQQRLKALFSFLESNSFEVSIVRPVADYVSKSEYPHICAVCGKYVVSRPDKRCGHCGSNHWKERVPSQGTMDTDNSLINTDGAQEDS